MVEKWDVVDRIIYQSRQIVSGTRGVSGHQYNQSGRKRTDGDASSLS